MKAAKLLAATAIATLGCFAAPAWAQDALGGGDIDDFGNFSTPNELDDFGRRRCNGRPCPSPTPEPGPREIPQPPPPPPRDVRGEQLVDLGCGLFAVVVGVGGTILAAETGPAAPLIGGAAGVFANEVCKDLAKNGVGGPPPPPAPRR